MELSGASCRLPGLATAERHLRAVVVKRCAGNFWGVFQPASDNANYHLISISHKNICCPGHLRLYREAETILCFSACGLVFKGFTDFFTLFHTFYACMRWSAAEVMIKVKCQDSKKFNKLYIDKKFWPLSLTSFVASIASLRLHMHSIRAWDKISRS